MWIETTITNCLKVDVEVREGHGSTFSSLKRLRPRESYKIRYDMHSTYRQYMIVGPDDKVWVLQSDHIIEYSAVKVVEATDEQGNGSWTLDLSRRLSKAQSVNHGDSTGGFLSKMNKILGRGGDD